MSRIQILLSIASMLVSILIFAAGQWLQRRAARKKEKRELFKLLMMYRGGMNDQCVQALNSIDVVFADDRRVLAAWREFRENAPADDTEEIRLRRSRRAWDKLLEAMAVSLGCGKQITWDTIQNPYIPPKK